MLTMTLSELAWIGLRFVGWFVDMWCRKHDGGMAASLGFMIYPLK